MRVREAGHEGHCDCLRLRRPKRSFSKKHIELEKSNLRTGTAWRASFEKEEAFLLTVGVVLLTVKLLGLQSLKALIRRTFPL